MAKLPEEEIKRLENELTNLHVQLDSDYSDIGDWKLVKNTEANLLGLPLPYDTQDLHERRQVVRDRISEIREILKNAEPEE